jgi:hypothetical protein
MSAFVERIAERLITEIPHQFFLEKALEVLKNESETFAPILAAEGIKLVTPFLTTNPEIASALVLVGVDLTDSAWVEARILDVLGKVENVFDAPTAIPSPPAV